MDNIKTEIIIENDDVKIIRFTYSVENPKEKQLAVQRLNQHALKYSENSGNYCTFFTDIKNPLHFVVEEKLK